jgi:uncharacterized membrane protein YidH (DUF202 family)
MAWIRSAPALISFGFTIAKIFELLRVKSGGHTPKVISHAIGILMIGIARLALGNSTIQYWLAVRGWRATCPDLPRSWSWITAMLIAMLGRLALTNAMING